MNIEELLKRIITIVSGVNLTYFNKFSSNDLSTIFSAMNYVKTLPIKFCDRSNVTIENISLISQHESFLNDVKLIVVDYLQIIPTTQNNQRSREQEVAKISRTLKQIARLTNAPVIALSQLSRKSVERRLGGKGSILEEDVTAEPKLIDLRESGAIEQDADIVCFLHSKKNSNINSDNNEEIPIDFLIEKHRNGRCGKIPLTFNKNLYKFE
jgi:replicative DNA helicase